MAAEVAQVRNDAGRRALVRRRVYPRWYFALPEARPRAGLPPMLIRSFATRPEPLPPRLGREPDGWMPRGHEHGAAARSWGPYRLSGGWWRRELSRDYFFVEQQRGALLWIFEGPAKRWHLQGEVR